MVCAVGGRFHGITPSKNKQDKRFKKVAEDLERKKRLMGTGGGEEGTIARLHAVQEQTATPYLVLPLPNHPEVQEGPAYSTPFQQIFCAKPCLPTCSVEHSWQQLL